MRCKSCSAPLLPNKAVCSYCGYVNDIDFANQHFHTTQKPQEPRICCQCQIPMESINVGSANSAFYIERCSTCQALFFDPGELDEYIHRHVREVFAIDFKGLQNLQQQNRLGAIIYRKCPVCQGMMNRVNFGRTSGIIVDQCIDHGLYLDAGELQRILAWVRKGGRLAEEKSRSENLTRKPAHQTIIPATHPVKNQEDHPLLETMGRIVKWLIT